MAWDYLSIQGLATPSEHAFSSGGLTGTKNLNCLEGTVFESLQLLKRACHNGHISVASDSKQHIDALIASFETEEVDDEDSWDCHWLAVYKTHVLSWLTKKKYSWFFNMPVHSSEPELDHFELNQQSDPRFTIICGLNPCSSSLFSKIPQQLDQTEPYHPYMWQCYIP